jgi:hypothetical protein
MRSALSLGLACGITLVAAGPCRADLILSLSSISDLNNLAPGQTLTVNVQLSGLNPGDRVDFLAATLIYNSNVLGVSTITPGPIIPDPSGFLQAAGPGIADALYDSMRAVSMAPLSGDGTLFSVDLPVTDLGPGVIAFAFVDSSGVSAGGDPLPLATAGSPLDFTSSPAAAVPGPPSWLLVAIGTAVLVGARRRGRRRRFRRGIV